MSVCLTMAQIEDRLRALNSGAEESVGWKLLDGKLSRGFVFADFADAFAFMTQVAVIAEQMDHHPEWSNIYNRVSVKLTTHDAGGVTSKDFALAEAINAAST